MIKAFSRDPTALFLSAGNNNSNSNATARAPRQPVQYARQVQLRIAMGQIPAGQTLHAVTVDWIHGRIACFASGLDVMNHVPLFSSLQNALPPCEPEHADVYVRETFAFLLRGHSLFHPGCRCMARSLPHRDAALGLLLPTHPPPHAAKPAAVEPPSLPSCRGGRKKQKKRPSAPPPPPPPPPPAGCAVVLRENGHGQARSLQEIALELGVRDLTGHVHVNLGRNARQMRLLDVLIHLAGMELSEDGRFLSSRLCCVPRAIRSGHDIEEAARILAPRPYVYNPAEHPDAVARRIIDADLRTLQEQRRVRVLASDTEGAWSVFWNGNALHLEPDPVIAAALRARWRQSASS